MRVHPSELNSGPAVWQLFAAAVLLVISVVVRLKGGEESDAQADNAVQRPVQSVVVLESSRAPRNQTESEEPEADTPPVEAYCAEGEKS